MTGPKRAFCYTRVSTDQQNTKAQEAELRDYVKRRGWTLKKVYCDKISGMKDVRPGLTGLMADCRKGQVDVVVVWKFDRFGRSLRHLVTALAEFKDLGVDFVSATEGVDTTSPAGELVFQIFGAIAQFERSLIVERVRAGLAQAKRDGKHLGRPAKRKLSASEVGIIRSERSRGVPLRALSKRFGATLWSVHQAGMGTK
jgi:DNA invertase Pin-like site-specific DNA recombinase